MDRITLPGSHRTSRPGHEVALHRTSPDNRVEVTLKLRRKAPLPVQGVMVDYASDAELRAIDEFKEEFDLVLVDWSPGERKVVLAGDVAAMEAAFGVELHDFEHPEVGTYRGHPGPVSIPAELGGIVEGVFGLDERPQAKPHFRRWQSKDVYRKLIDDAGTICPAPEVQSSPPGAFTPPQLAALYGFPAGYHGQGQTIGIIELGGGYRPADLRTYFQSLGLPEMPTVISASVDGGKNAPTGNPDGPDGEVMLDIEVVGAICPKAKVVVYFAGNTDRGFIDAVSQAIHDATNKPSVVSISWGGPESSWTAAALQQFDQVLAEAAALGVTVTVASGDNGSSDGVADGQNHVDFPASSPHILACGGTSVRANGPTIAGETVWNEGGGASGGGFSTTFASPAWQAEATGHHAGRGVPDVAGNADPATGWLIRVDGNDIVLGGTSAVAPLFAALIAIANQRNGKRAGFINPAIYANPSAFNDITVGNNGAYAAGPGWDPATGLGSPRGLPFADVLRG